MLSYQENLKNHLHQIHTIDTSLSKIRPQIRDRNNIDINIGRVVIILPTSIILPVGYINPWGHQMTHPRRIEVETAGRFLRSHRNIGEKVITEIRRSKSSIKVIDNILKKL